jgi:hypothetical protein
MLARGIAAWEGNSMTLNSANGAAGLQRKSAGIIEVYPGEAGRVGIDACVRLSIAEEMLSEIHTASNLYICQSHKGGMVAIDAQFPLSVAEKILAAATRDGVLVRR